MTTATCPGAPRFAEPLRRRPVRLCRGTDRRNPRAHLERTPPVCRKCGSCRCVVEKTLRFADDLLCRDDGVLRHVQLGHGPSGEAGLAQDSCQSSPIDQPISDATEVVGHPLLTDVGGKIRSSREGPGTVLPMDNGYPVDVSSDNLHRVATVKRDVSRVRTQKHEGRITRLHQRIDVRVLGDARVSLRVNRKSYAGRSGNCPQPVQHLTDRSKIVVERIVGAEGRRREAGRIHSRQGMMRGPRLPP